MKRKIMSFVLSAVLLLSSSSILQMNVSAKNVEKNPPSVSNARREVTEWYYRYNKQKSRLEKRLWSNTYNYWKTGWMDFNDLLNFQVENTRGRR